MKNTIDLSKIATPFVQQVKPVTSEEVRSWLLAVKDLIWKQTGMSKDSYSIESEIVKGSDNLRNIRVTMNHRYIQLSCFEQQSDNIIYNTLWARDNNTAFIGQVATAIYNGLAAVSVLQQNTQANINNPQMNYEESESADNKVVSDKKSEKVTVNKPVVYTQAVEIKEEKKPSTSQAMISESVQTSSNSTQDSKEFDIREFLNSIPTPIEKPSDGSIDDSVHYEFPIDLFRIYDSIDCYCESKFKRGIGDGTLIMRDPINDFVKTEKQLKQWHDSIVPNMPFEKTKNIFKVFGETWLKFFGQYILEYGYPKKENTINYDFYGKDYNCILEVLS